VPVIWIRQEFAPDLSDAFPHMRKSNRSYTIKGTDGCRLLKELVTEPSDGDVVKKRFSAFFETVLDRELRKRNVSTVVLAGITTSWCVRSTAVDAYQLGYNVILVDGTLAGFNEADHESSLREMDGYLASVATVDDVADLFARESAR
jgi:nicotinamidase-related amidase